MTKTISTPLCEQLLSFFCDEHQSLERTESLGVRLGTQTRLRGMPTDLIQDLVALGYERQHRQKLLLILLSRVAKELDVDVSQIRMSQIGDATPLSKTLQDLRQQVLQKTLVVQSKLQMVASGLTESNFILHGVLSAILNLPPQEASYDQRGRMRERRSITQIV